MTQRSFARISLALAAAALIVTPLAPAPAHAQDGGRFQILVTNLKPTDGTRDRFGERTGDRLRDIIDLDQYVAISERDLNRFARTYDLSLADLDCNAAMQLAAIMPAPLVICGTYHTQGDLIGYSVRIITIPGLEEFGHEFTPLPERDNDEAGDLILAFFTETKDRLDAIAYCIEDFVSSNWEGALEYCQRALDQAPTHREARLALGRAHMELNQYAEALEQFQVILDADEYNSSALETAGWLAAQLDQRELAREYYGRYLVLNPDNVQVRIQIAVDLATSGDDLGAMELLQAGLEQDPTNIDLHTQNGAMAFRAAAALERELATTQPAAPAGAPLPSQISDLYRTAISSHMIVLDSISAEMRPIDIINMIRAYVRIGDIDGAVALADRIIDYFREHADVLDAVAVAYNRGGFMERAIETTEHALEINPDLPDGRFRMANFLLGADRIDDAIDWANRANDYGERTPDAIGSLLLGHGYSQKAQQGMREEAIVLFRAAKGLDGITSGFRSQVDFFHAFVRYQMVEPEAQTATDEATARRLLPIFQNEIAPLLEGAAEYAESSGNQASLQSIVDGMNTYIDIMGAIIRRAEQAAG